MVELKFSSSCLHSLHATISPVSPTLQPPSSQALQRDDDERFAAGITGYNATALAIAQKSPKLKFVVVGEKWADEPVPANCTHVPTFSEFLLKLTAPRTFVVVEAYAANAAKLLGDAEAGVTKGDVVVDMPDASLAEATSREAAVAAVEGGYLGVWSATSAASKRGFASATAAAPRARRDARSAAASALASAAH